MIICTNLPKARAITCTENGGPERINILLWREWERHRAYLEAGENGNFAAPATSAWQVLEIVQDEIIGKFQCRFLHVFQGTGRRCSQAG